MRFLVDMPVSPAVARWLQEQGHDAVHASSLGLERASDSELLARALDDDRVVVTADTDFPHLLALSAAQAPGVILFRGGDYTARDMTELLARVLAAVPQDELTRSVCVVDRRRIRHRPLPLS
ncbi:MAG: DUF5615 family PIN-like protein [Armatimonadota bacterium]